MNTQATPVTGRNQYKHGYLFIAVFLLINTANQIVFKTIALGPGGSSYLGLIVEPFFYLSLLLFAGQAVAWLAVLQRLPLSHAYPFNSLSVITILASGVIFFGESLTPGNMIGALTIMVGVAVIASGTNEFQDSDRSRL